MIIKLFQDAKYQHTLCLRKRSNTFIVKILKGKEGYLPVSGVRVFCFCKSPLLGSAHFHCWKQRSLDLVYATWWIQYPIWTFIKSYVHRECPQINLFLKSPKEVGKSENLLFNSSTHWKNSFFFQESVL